MLKKKTSVLIVSADGNPNKKIQIPTFLLSYWKHIAFSFATVVLLGVVGIVYFVNHRNEKLYADVYLEKIDKLRQRNQELTLDDASKQVNIDDVRRSINSFDSTLNRINAKMKKRGLKAIALNNAGGPLVEDDDNLEELAKFYVNMLEDVENRLDGAPFGRPHSGRITSRYGYRGNPFTGGGRERHSGIDFKGRTGENIKSTAKGTVIFAGYKGGYGNLVAVKHANGYETRYAHLSRIRVKRGQRIDVGTTVGLLGSTGRSTGPHLHYEVLQGGRTINPEKYFQF